MRLSFRIPLSPPMVLSVGFLLLIVIGTVLLKLGMSTYLPISWLHAMFTATSAVTVTGLTVVDMEDFTRVGQVIIAVLIQMGGLGFMTFAVLAFFSLQRRLNLSGQLVACEALGQTSFGNVIETAKSVVTIALTVELIGFVLLSIAFMQDLPISEALYHGFFYTISAFNNAGFGLTDANLAPYIHNGWITFTVTLLVIIGGLGFVVIKDVSKQRRWQRFNVNTKLMLTATLVINLIAFVLFWLLEHNNPNTLAHFSLSNQISAAWFQAITPRTAGFTVLPIDHLSDASTLLTMFLMFIGGGSLSTASGIKVGTFIVLLLTTLEYLRQRNHVTVFKRAIPEKQVRKALALVSITMLLILLSMFVLALVEPHHDLVDVLFEVVSALSTVGLTRGLTPHLGSSGEVVIMFMMYAGRLGPLTLAYFIAVPKSSNIRYPETNLLIG